MNAAAYYNEVDSYAAQWLRNLIADGLIPGGDVDERDIRDVDPDDLRGYTQAHFFAGIGGWPYAARLSGWPDDRPLWTGSCPCQPFSVAGKRKGTDDERDLWPDFFRLIRARRPFVVMGEQVAGFLGDGWFHRVRANLEGEDYASRCVDIPALAVDAPHIRQRLYWIACDERVADADSGVEFGRADEPEWSAERRVADRRPDPASELADADGGGRQTRDDNQAGRPGHPVAADGRQSAWAGSEWLVCGDGKARRVEPGIRLLADGIPAERVARLRAAGNAIVPPLAAEVIRAFMEAAE